MHIPAQFSLQPQWYVHFVFNKIGSSLRLNYASDSQQIKHSNKLKISTSLDSFQSFEEHCIRRPGNNTNTQTTENNNNWHTLVHF